MSTHPNTNCPNCSRSFRYPAARGGTVASCPACKSQLVLPLVESPLPPQMPPPMSGKPEPPPQQFTAEPVPVVVHVHHKESNTAPLLLNLFLLPGLGQIVQNRVWTGLFLLLCWLISLPLMCVGIGFVTAPIVYIAAAVDVAMQK